MSTITIRQDAQLFSQIIKLHLKILRAYVHHKNVISFKSISEENIYS